MIELRTGLPRNGKTLATVADLANMFKEFDKEDSSLARPVLTHNIKDLTLPVTPFPVTETTDRFGTKRVIPDWDAVPDGALCVLDEAQDLFPPRSTQSEAPPHVAFLNKHGHRNLDLIVITQHPKLLDFSLRSLVGKHKHYRRTFGWNMAICYEWDGCSDNLQGMKNAVTTRFDYPTWAYSLYTSASGFTKQKFKYPLWLAMPIIGLIACAVALPWAYKVITKGPGSKTELVQSKQSIPYVPGGTVPAQAGGAVGGPLGPSEQAPPNPSLPSSPDRTTDLASSREFAGCIAKADRCLCMTAVGDVVDEPKLCRESAQSFGYLVKVSVAPSQSRAAGPSMPHEIRQPASR